MKFTNPCWLRSTSERKFDRSCSSVSTLGTSKVDMPIQSVAQNTMFWSLANGWALPPPTSPAEPRSPWPYSETRAFGDAEPWATALRGTVQITLAVVVFPGMARGLPSAPRLNDDPGGQPGASR